jgi:hypothetical protein
MLLSISLFVSLISTCYAQYNGGYYNNGGWRGSYSGIVIGLSSHCWTHSSNTHIFSAVIAAVILLLSCCVINRRRRFARTTNPSVKPPIFGTAPPGYSLPLWNNTNRVVQPEQHGSGHPGSTDGMPSYQHPTPSNPPPPPYAKQGEGNETYPPVGAVYLSTYFSAIEACFSSLLVHLLRCTLPYVVPIPDG